MASSMLTGDRRWAAPARKSGLQILGKVPKPINLPSQRSENHGLDPNVEIVPKGTLTWGSRGSSATPNAWGTSSPNADGSTGSLSHRPSSGSGTRPSTAGSDRSHEPACNAWGPNSRPSSASGVSATSQISAAAASRPRSADTRPGSSQLSRFADNSVDSTVAWGAAGTAERLGNASSKSSGFTLSSGDFPSLGSDKNCDTQSQRGHSSQGRPHSSQGRPHSSQGRPASASGADSKQKEFFEPQSPGNRGDRIVNHWIAENPPYAGPGAPPNIENLHRDPHPPPPYQNMNIPPPHYDSWHNPPFPLTNRPWFRGGPPDHHHVPARPLPNPHFPRPDAGPGVFHNPNSYEQYRPYMPPPEHYMSPNHPDIRPGPYPGPIPYERYFGPPQASLTGMARPVFPNQYPTQHPGNFNARPGGYAPVVNKELRKPDQAHETQGQYRVLLKQHDGLEVRDEQEKAHSVTTDTSQFERGKPTKSQVHQKAEFFSSEAAGDVDGHPTNANVRNLSADSSKVADEGLLRKPEAAKVQTRDLQQYPVIKKNAALMEKVEGLNNKARNTDSHGEGGSFSSKEKPTYFKDMTARADQLTANSAGNVAAILNMKTSIPKELSVEDKNQQSTNHGKNLSAPLISVAPGENARFVGQKKAHVVEGADRHAKSRSNRGDNNVWMEMSPANEPSVNATVTNVKGVASVTDASQAVPEKKELRLAASGRDGAHAASTLDPVDEIAQRAKRRELAIQRAKQLQQEEEERTREQKAKALAKLEELNRRTVAESSNLQSNLVPVQSSDTLNSKEETKPDPISMADAVSTESSSGTTSNEASHSETVKHVDLKKPDETTNLPSNVTPEASHSVVQISEVPRAQSLAAELETNAKAEITQGATSDDVEDNTSAKPKQIGYRKKHTPKDIGETTNDTLRGHENPPVQPRRRNNKSPRNYNSTKPNEVHINSSEDNLEKLHTESEKIKSSVSVEEAMSVPKETTNATVRTSISREVPDKPESTEESLGMVSNNWKSRPQRKTTRNQQVNNKSVSKNHVAQAVMWAPVKPQSKNNTSATEAKLNIVAEVTKPSVKSGNDSQSGLKAKRAEIERYVPKPVAKELSQQVNSQQQISPSVDIKPEVGSPSVESGNLDRPNSRNGENSKHVKHGKTNTSWRQRTSGESLSIEQKNVQKPSNIDNLARGPVTNSDDGWNDNNNDNVIQPNEPVSTAVVSKSYGANRQRRQPSKAHKVTGTNYSTSDNIEPQQKITEQNEHQFPALAPGEIQNWQPKPMQGKQRSASYGPDNPPATNEDNRAETSNTRFQRGYDPNYSGHDRKQNFQMSRDRRKNNPRVEYQRVGSYDNKLGDLFQENLDTGEGTHEPSQAPGPRYRGRGRNFQRGGGQFYERSTRVDDSYNNWE